MMVSYRYRSAQEGWRAEGSLVIYLIASRSCSWARWSSSTLRFDKTAFSSRNRFGRSTDFRHRRRRETWQEWKG
jgi:hypothetical protein